MLGFRLKGWNVLKPLLFLSYLHFTLQSQDSCVQDRSSKDIDGGLNKFKDSERKHPCKRICQVGEEPMLCKYDFEIDWYRTMIHECRNCPYTVSDCFLPGCVPGDGVQRAIVVVNRQLPGPPIEVCKNDVVVVDVRNNMYSEPTTIHWHGQPQRHSPYMDGVPYITQCPIQPCNSFRYTFNASQSGTHFWHSHIGMQRVDGAFGPFIVRVPKEENYHQQLYNYDLSSHIIVINEWDSVVGGDMLLKHIFDGGPTAPANLLVNGLGRFKKFSKGPDNIYVPTARFKVRKGFRYRFRLINSGSLNCPIEMSIDNHMISIISSDGVDVKPTKVASLISYAGERFDFILHANQSIDLYWIKFKGLINCKDKKVFQLAVLEYADLNKSANLYPHDVVTYSNAHNKGIQANPLNKGSESSDDYVPVTRLQAVVEEDASLKKVPDFQYYIGFDLNKVSNKEYDPQCASENITNRHPSKLYIPQFNHISLKMPKIALLPQRNEVSEEDFCNNETMERVNCTQFHCRCLHGLKIPLGAVVEFVFVDEGLAFDINHPVHLHGYHFRVIAMERVAASVTVDEIKSRDRLGLIKRNLINAPLKDTVTVPDGGYTIVRFQANSPGYWILHCHIEVHLALGMAIVLQVGEKSEMPPVPKDFPKCGDYVPDIIDSLQRSGGEMQSSVDVFVLLFTFLSTCFYLLIIII